jgi:hypothetical protein
MEDERAFHEAFPLLFTKAGGQYLRQQTAFNVTGMPSGVP